MNVADYVRKHPDCNYFISASAGTGKTYTMANYYLGILEKEKDPNIVERILTTTFTVKAAAEMKQRISNEVLKMEKNSKKASEKNYWKRVKSKMPRALISTIDSFCQGVLREENFSVNVDPNLTIINDLKRDKVIERSVYTAFRMFFEAYEGKEPDLPNVLKTSERGKRIKKFVEDLKNDKVALKVLFSEYRLDALQIMVNDVLVNWRTEMKSSSVLKYVLLEDKIIYDALNAFKTLVLIASEVYESMTSDVSEFDYKGVLEKTLQTLKVESIGEKYSQRFKYILVDEYQDTNYLQKALFDTLHNDSNYIFYVGDRKQSIYRFRGSDVTVFTTTYKEFEDKEKKGENYKVLSLKTNYRSKESLVDYFNEVVKKNIFNPQNVSFPAIDDVKKEFRNVYDDVFFRKDDVSLSHKKEDESENVPSLCGHDKKRIKYVHVLEERGSAFFRVRAEAKAAAKIVKALVKEDNGISYKDITILRRSLKSAESIYKEIFKEEGVPLYVVGSHAFYSRPEIEGIISALKAVQNSHNDYLFTLFFFSPLTNGDLETFDKIVLKRKEISEESKGKEKISLFAASESVLDDLPQEIKKAHEILRKYADLKYFIRPTEIVKGLVKDLDYVAKLSKWEDRRIALYNLKKLLSGMEDFDQMANSFSELIRLISKIKEKSEEEAALEDDQSDSVKMMTIHKSKGLEFKVVILGETFKKYDEDRNEEEVQFSLPKAGARHFVMEKLVEENLKNNLEDVMKEFYVNAFMNYTEERRLLYVAITRASELLIPIFVSNSKEHLFSEKESFSKNLNVKSSFYDLISVEEIKAQEVAQNIQEKLIFQEVPQENLKSFDSFSYKMYIAPTFLRKIEKESEMENIDEMTDESLPVVSIGDVFSDDEKGEGKKIHSILSSVQNLSDLKYFEEMKLISPKRPLSENPIIQRLFTYPVQKVEWRLMKPLKLEEKTYMLFGIPDRVFIKDGEIEVVDYKHSYLRRYRNGSNRIEDYIFQLNFYMYLLSDFGKPKMGYLVSTKSGEIIEVEYQEDFESKIIDSIREVEAEKI
jgi:ATP-dependent helicase/nuclease subunit A